jgi:hypothetical protein
MQFVRFLDHRSLIQIQINEIDKTTISSANKNAKIQKHNVMQICTHDVVFLHFYVFMFLCLFLYSYSSTTAHRRLRLLLLLLLLRQ